MKEIDSLYFYELQLLIEYKNKKELLELSEMFEFGKPLSKQSDKAKEMVKKLIPPTK